MSKHIIVCEDAETELLVLANILNKLRYTTKYWEEHYGSPAKTHKKRWEEKADEWILKHTKEVDE